MLKILQKPDKTRNSRKLKKIEIEFFKNSEESQIVLDSDWAKNISKSHMTKNSWKFVYIWKGDADPPSLWRIFWQTISFANLIISIKNCS